MQSTIGRILGIILIILFAMIIIISISNVIFNIMVRNEIKLLFASHTDNHYSAIQSEDLAQLPGCVQNWLYRSGVVGHYPIMTVRLRQNALMRSNELSPWLPIKAEQYFLIDDPAFIWKAKVTAAPMFFITGRDKYMEGKGNMLVKLLSVITIANSTGPEMDQGVLLRYLAEMVFFPSAALKEYLFWEEIDATSAKVTMSWMGVTASGIFKFSPEGDPVSFSAERYKESDGQYILTPWLILMDSYREFQGVRVPDKGRVIWRLEQGDFNWFVFDISEIEYNETREF